MPLSLHYCTNFLLYHFLSSLFHSKPPSFPPPQCLSPASPQTSLRSTHHYLHPVIHGSASHFISIITQSFLNLYALGPSTPAPLPFLHCKLHESKDTVLFAVISLWYIMALTLRRSSIKIWWMNNEWVMLPKPGSLIFTLFFPSTSQVKIHFDARREKESPLSWRGGEMQPLKLSAFPEGLNSFQERSEKQSPLEPFQGRHAPKSTTKTSPFPNTTEDRSWIRSKACYWILCLLSTTKYIMQRLN